MSLFRRNFADDEISISKLSLSLSAVESLHPTIDKKNSANLNNPSQVSIARAFSFKVNLRFENPRMVIF